MQAPLPLDESARLAALRQYDVLDTPPEAEFDDLVHLAAQICGTPISAITLVDENRQWFKSRLGLEPPETPRDVSFCAHAILGAGLLVVPDATRDERFADNPFVAGGPIRFYAGVPLVSPEGQAVGALCVVDTVPRQLDQGQQDALRRLGRQAVALLEARPEAGGSEGQSRQARQRLDQEKRAVAATIAQQDADNLKFSEVRYRRLFEAAQDGILILDAETGKIEDVNPYLCRLLGYGPEEFVGKQLWEIGTFRDIVANQAGFRDLQARGYVRYDDLPLRNSAGGSVAVEFVSNVYLCADKRVVQCNIRDISERKQAKAVERESQRFLQSTLDALAPHIAVLDDGGRIIAVNRAWQQFSEANDGTAASCGVGAHYIEVCEAAKGAWAEEAPTLASGIREVMAEPERAFCLEYPCHSPQEKRWFNVCVTRFAGEGPVRVVVSHENITERKRAEATTTRLGAILEATPDFVGIADTAQHPVFLNRAARQMIGIGETEEISDVLVAEMCAPWAQNLLDEGIACAIREGVWSGESALLTRSGREIPISQVILAHKTDDGQLEFISTVARDISERIQAQHELQRANDELELHVMERTAELATAITRLSEELGERARTETALRAAQQMLQLVMNHIPQAIFWKDRDCIYLGCNGRLASDAGFDSPEEMTGKNDFEMPWAEYADDFRADDRQVMETDTPKLNIEEPLLKADGQSVWLRTNKIPLHDANDRVVGVLCSYEDITEQKRAEAAIHQARREADAANQAKSEFLSRMSHELRTPLNAILGFSQILDKQPLDPLSKEGIGYILQAGRHLLDLINEVLNLARVESGRLEMFLEPLLLSEIVPETCALVRPLAAERYIRLDETSAELGRVAVLADRQRFKQVLINLLGNAIKYNRESGQVKVSCQLKPNGRIAIAVRDTGDGIAPQDLPKLFKPFERLSAASSLIEGTGLGLVFAQRLIIAMGGTLGVQSTLGRGSTFTIELPQATLPQEVLANLTQSPLPVSTIQAVNSVYCVLCIEDNASNLRLLEAIFEMRPNVTLLTAMEGKVGLELARQYEPDLILLDLNLPDVAGTDVLAALNRSGLTRGIPVVITSADATPSQIERLLSAGASAYLTKPFDVGQFFHTLDKFLHVKQAADGEALN